MDRRGFIRKAGVAAAAVPALAAPAIAQSMPELKWRMTSSFPKALDTIFGAAETFSKFVAEATDNKFQIQVFPGGEIAPPLEAANEVGKGNVEMCHTASYYYWGKDPTYAFATAVPFGLNSRMQNAWMYHGGGMDMMNEFYDTQNLIAFPCGNTGAQMGGWFRKEIKSAADLQGVKMRIGGFGGKVISKVGVVPTSIAGGDIYPALEKGAIDGAEWVGPYDDEKLGFHKIAKFYYYPGWWEANSMSHLFINLDKWNSLPKSYQAAMQAAGSDTLAWMVAKYDVSNPPALKRMLSQGVQLKSFSEDVLDACFKAADDTYAEMSEQSADFKKVWAHMKAFRADQFLWQQIAEYTMDSYMMIQQGKKKL